MPSSSSTSGPSARLTQAPLILYVQCVEGKITFFHDAAATDPYTSDPLLPVQFGYTRTIQFQITADSDTGTCFADPPISWSDGDQPPGITVEPLAFDQRSFALVDVNTSPHQADIHHGFLVEVETGARPGHYESITGADPTVVDQGEEGGRKY